jgi:hypothetical protein
VVVRELVWTEAAARAGGDKRVERRRKTEACEMRRGVEMLEEEFL